MAASPDKSGSSLPGSAGTRSSSVNQDQGQRNINYGNKEGLFLAINAQCVKDEGFLTPKCQEQGLWRGLQTQDGGSCVQRIRGPGRPGEGAAYFLSLMFCVREREKVMVTCACCYVKIDTFPILNEAGEKVGQATSRLDCHRVQGKGGGRRAGDPPPPQRADWPGAHARQGHISEGQEPPQGACVLQGVSGLKSRVKANTCEFPARETEQGRHCRGPSCVRVLKRKQKGLSTAPEPEDARMFSHCVADRLFSSKMLRISGRGRTAGRQGPGSMWPRPEETAESTDVGGKTLVSQIGVSRSSGWGHKPHGQPQPGRGGRARVSGCNWTSHSCPGPLGPLSGSVEAAL